LRFIADQLTCSPTHLLSTLPSVPPLSIQHAAKNFPGGVIALADLCLDLRDGELLALVGPSGSGKTTLLRAIAGLERLDSGVIRLGDVMLDGVPPRRRNVAMVFQQPALYPHLRVRDNIAFPLRMRGERRAVIAIQVNQIALRLAIQPLLDRRPHQLSGGQAQRVALARALVRKPHCLLLDEPLSNLDAPLRAELRTVLKSLHAAEPITTLHVTHDQEEALALGDRVAVLHEGRLQQIGTPEEVTQQPANAFVAEFFRHVRV
jgi:ABC-type sugar transport system ATPase subunit